MRLVLMMFLRFDDKKYILDDEINTLTYFHKDKKNCEFNRNDKNL